MGNNKEFKDAIDRRIADYICQIDILHKCIPIIEKFDGKLLNGEVCKAVKSELQQYLDKDLGDGTEGQSTKTIYTEECFNAIAIYCSDSKSGICSSDCIPVAAGEGEIKYEKAVTSIHRRIRVIKKYIKECEATKMEL